MKFIHAADIHLDSPLRGLAQYEGAPVDEIRGATRRALENLVQLALDEQADLLLIAGDLYDGDWPDHNTGLFFVAQMARLRAAGIPVALVHGNHDATSKMSRSLPLPENVFTFSDTQPETIDGARLGKPELNIAIHGLSFAAAAVPRNVVPELPVSVAGCFNIGLLHTSLDSENEDHHSRYAPCSLADLTSKGYNYWALGHIHQRAIRCESPLVVFPGNVQGRHIRETGPKGCMLVTVDERGEAACEFRPLDVFRWSLCEVDAGGAADGDEVLRRFVEQLRHCISETSDGLPLAVRVLVTGSSPAHPQLARDPHDWAQQLRAAALDVSAGAVWIEKVKLLTTPQRDWHELVAAGGAIGELVDYIAELQAGDADSLAELFAELADLRRKMPAELLGEPDGLPLERPEQLAAVLDEVQPLLISLLQAQEDAR